MHVANRRERTEPDSSLPGHAVLERSVEAARLQPRPNTEHWQERVDLAAAFRWTERLNLHEAVSSHFSLAVNEDGTRFLMNPNQAHFSRMKASGLLLLDASDPDAHRRA